MRAAISNIKIVLDAPTRLLNIQMQVKNVGHDLWSTARGFAAATQIRDPESSVTILESRHSVITDPISPGQSTEISMSIKLPPINGQFHIFVSMLKGDLDWFFNSGSSFLLIEYRTSNGYPEIIQQKVTTLTALRNHHLWRTVKRAFSYPVLIFPRHGSLILSMVRRDLLGRYRGSFAGLFWTVMHPVMMMLTYYFVFGIVLKTRFGEDDNPSNFVLYFLAGMLPWLAISEAVGRAPNTIVEHSNFVKKLMFPVETLPVTLVIAGLVSEAFGVGVFIVGMATLGNLPNASLLYLPAVLVPQFLLTLGLCWILAALGVFFRDLSQFIGFALTVWFFTTPICYPEAALPKHYRWLFEVNPLYVLVQSYRSILIEASPPPLGSLGWLTLGTVVIFLFGYGWFHKLKRSFSSLI